jgi:hypothetical protein
VLMAAAAWLLDHVLLPDPVSTTAGRNAPARTAPAGTAPAGTAPVSAVPGDRAQDP